MTMTIIIMEKGRAMGYALRFPGYQRRFIRWSRLEHLVECSPAVLGNEWASYGTCMRCPIPATRRLALLDGADAEERVHGQGGRWKSVTIEFGYSYSSSGYCRRWRVRGGLHRRCV